MYKIRYNVCCEFKITVEENKKLELIDPETTKKLLLDKLTWIAFILFQQYPNQRLCDRKSYSYISMYYDCLLYNNTIPGSIDVTTLTSNLKEDLIDHIRSETGSEIKIIYSQ